MLLCSLGVKRETAHLRCHIAWSQYWHLWSQILACTAFTWLAKECVWDVTKSHKEHSLFLIFKWTALKWIANDWSFDVAYSHWGHILSLILSCMDLTCILKVLVSCVKYSQNSHFFLSPTFTWTVFTCLFNLALQTNLLWQISHCSFLIFSWHVLTCILR